LTNESEKKLKTAILELNRQIMVISSQAPASSHQAENINIAASLAPRTVADFGSRQQRDPPRQGK
jgi:hypothetical protein